MYVRVYLPVHHLTCLTPSPCFVLSSYIFWTCSTFGDVSPNIQCIISLYSVAPNFWNNFKQTLKTPNKFSWECYRSHWTIIIESKHCTHAVSASVSNVLHSWKQHPYTSKPGCLSKKRTKERPDRASHAETAGCRQTRIIRRRDSNALMSLEGHILYNTQRISGILYTHAIIRKHTHTFRHTQTRTLTHTCTHTHSHLRMRTNTYAPAYTIHRHVY